MEKENYESLKTGTPENKKLNRQPNESLREAVDASNPVSSVSGAPNTRHVADNVGGHPAAVEKDDMTTSNDGIE